MIQRTINSSSPAAAMTLTVQQISVQIGTGDSASPYDETFIYDPATHASGILLSNTIAPGTRPQVYLNGLRMLTRPEGDSSGGDVSFSTTLEGASSSFSFEGLIYSPAAGDTIHVKYWYPA